MDSVVFANKGLMDIRCVTTFGVSAKGDNDNPIGQFGTGLKYAIAVLLRHGLQIEICIGNTYYSFHTETQNIRGKEFDFVVMKAVDDTLTEPKETVTELSFTTELGKSWELWMAFRELYSNCLDEKGQCFLGEEDALTCDDTVILVTGEEFVNLFKERNSIVLDKTEPKVFKDLEMFEGESNYVYNRGIRVVEYEKPLLYTYNIDSKISLTEDRTLKYYSDLDNRITSSVLASNDEEYVTKVLTASEDYYESSLNFSYSRVTDSFLAIVKKLIKKGKDKINPTVVRLYENTVKEKRAKNTRKTVYVDVSVSKDLTNSEICDLIRSAVNSIDELDIMDVEI